MRLTGWPLPKRILDLYVEFRLLTSGRSACCGHGLLGAMALRAVGFQVWVYSREQAPNKKADIVEAIGGTYVSSTDTTVIELAQMVGNIDLVYEAVGASSLALEVAQVLGVNGVFIFTGVPGRKEPIPIDTDLLMRNMVLKKYRSLQKSGSERKDVVGRRG